MDISLTREGDVGVLTWREGENRINHDSLARLNELLDELETSDGPLALVLTGDGKFFSNGLDLGRFEPFSDEYHATLKELRRTVGRFLIFPAYSVAAINGHAFAGGALISLAFDYRVMREDRGYWCMNEVGIGLAVDAELWPILTNRLPRATAIHAVSTAHRYPAPEALGRGIVEEMASGDEVLRRAIEVAQEASTIDKRALRYQKRVIYGDVAKQLGFDYQPSGDGN
jgi:enoyl-CoA hydratase/carnithine racemase